MSATTTRPAGAPVRDRFAEHARLERGEWTPLQRACELQMTLVEYLAWCYPGYQPNPIQLPPERRRRRLTLRDRIARRVGATR